MFDSLPPTPPAAVVQAGSQRLSVSIPVVLATGEDGLAQRVPGGRHLLRIGVMLAAGEPERSARLSVRGGTAACPAFGLTATRLVWATCTVAVARQRHVLEVDLVSNGAVVGHWEHRVRS